MSEYEQVDYTDTMKEATDKINANFTRAEAITVNEPIKFTFETALLSWTCHHNLNTDKLTIQTFDASGDLFIPNEIVRTSSNTITINNVVAQSGYVIIQY